ncbi:MAG: LysM peptidoglycan-binding domain-containing protein [Bacteroidales bacterium]|nr:LysM peptidoglycan-binding domain-containing protein [Bacteroidales bacterium]
MHLSKNITSTFILIFLLLSCFNSFGQQKISLFSNKNKKTISYLNQKIDSLQRAYDSLMVDYQNATGPIELSDTTSIFEEEPCYLQEYTTENVDSLLNIWYEKSQNELDMGYDDTETDTLTSNIPDSIYIERLKQMNSFISLPYNNIIRNYIIRYTQKMPDKIQTILGKSKYYLPIFEEIFDQYDLPKELKAMAVIESALNPKAVSRSRAKGMWQFMYGTAKIYNLRMTSFVDERYDPIASCHAAAQYLKDSYLIFGDWTLAIASYNCGAGNVNKAIRRSGGSKDFWTIYKYLPRETRGYIPAFVAALYTLNYYPEHNITPTQMDMPAHLDTFQINQMLHFQQISDNIGIPIEVLRSINPQYTHDIVPGTERTYILRLPYTYSMQFVDKEKEIYTYKDSTFFNPVEIKKITELSGNDGQRTSHKVRNGETLGHIAIKYKTSVSNIKRWNNLRSNTIKIGQKLYIYGSNSSVSSGGESVTSLKVKTTSSQGFVMYTVKKNDTLWGIANKFTGISLNDILQINGFGRNVKIYPGMKIRIKNAS